MLPLLQSAQIRDADAYTIAHEPIASIDLMERASKAFLGWFINHFPDKEKSIAIYCGTGNNGGDGLAIARLLNDHQYAHLRIKIVEFSDRSSPDFIESLKRIKTQNIPYQKIERGGDILGEDAEIIIDALLGTGINKPLTGDFKKLVDYLNGLEKTVIAVDVPTGFFCEGEIDSAAAVLKADVVVTFQQPKINFLLPESAPFINCFEVVNIGLDKQFIRSLNSPYQLIEERDISQRIKPRRQFDHKGTHGHALVIAGQPETMGAALLCSSACAYTGAGLTTVCIPRSGLTALNTSHPEIMAIVRDGQTLPDIAWSKFTVLGIGPGLGTDADSLQLFAAVLDNFTKPMIIDADALNMLSSNVELCKKIPAGSIVTPHMKEFDRLFGEHKNWWHRMETAVKKAKEHDLHIVLKNRYTMIVTPDGMVYFNPTGNPAMGSGGMGDVLTGIVTSLLAQGYNPLDACLIGVYAHGKAGDMLALPKKLNTVLAGQVAGYIPVVLAKLSA